MDIFEKMLQNNFWMWGIYCLGGFVNIFAGHTF